MRSCLNNAQWCVNVAVPPPQPIRAIARPDGPTPGARGAQANPGANYSVHDDLTAAFRDGKTMVKKTSRSGRWHVASRVIAALIPGFLVTNTTGILLSFLIPGVDKLTAIATATVLSYVIYTAIILWIFSVERLRTVWLGLLGALAVTGAGSWLMYTLEAAA
ncbi:MAG: hypothetical protein AAGM22_01375 [Acidobacteriota bacterium]